MSDGWIDQAVARYLRATAALESAFLSSMITTLALAEHDLLLASDQAHTHLAGRVGEIKANLESAQVEIMEVVHLVQARTTYLRSL